MCTTSTMWKVSLDRTVSWIDWTHANSIAATTAGGGEVVDLSLRQFDEIIRLPSSLASVSWTLSPWPMRGDFALTSTYTDPPVSAMFQGQHDVHTDGAANVLMMFDNTGDADGARVLSVSLDLPLPSAGAEIDEVWMLADDGGNPWNTCTREGSARRVGAANDVLAMCAPEYSFEELDNDDGSPHVPPLIVSVPDTSTFCSTGSFIDRMDIGGWYRAIPLTAGGDFTP
jgi:hypothetical protein